jgi:outer membrane biosynthesis protein TonB
MAMPAGGRSAPGQGTRQSSGPHRPRILRIGIIQGGRIVEERLVRKRENISLGQSARNMFVVPSDALPRHWLMFEITPRGYVAHFADAMDARIAVGNEIISLAQLKQSGKIRRHGHAWVLLLDERSRGKITVGDLTILFQFVTPPPPQPRPQLPASVRGSFTSSLDWAFTTIAALSFIGHLVMVIYLRSVDWPRKPDIEEIPDRFVQMVVRKPEPPKETPKTEEVKEEEKPAEKPKVASGEKRPKKEISAEEKARMDAERRARLAEQVKNTGILKLLGAKADGAGSIADVLGKGDVDRDQERAFQGVGGLTVATGDGSLRGVKSGTGGTGKVANISGLRGGGSGISGASTGNVGAERKVTAVVKSEAPAVDGQLDPNIIVREVKARMSAIKACYERALKRNPNLSGKVVIRWTITAAGTVTGVDVDQDSLNDSEVTGCIKSLVARWRFPAPSGGSVEVSFPFVFQASQ